jgi:dihydropyrimidinase
MSILIRGGQIVSAEGVRRGDILTRANTIAAVADSLPDAAANEVIDAAGQYVFPGGLDPHVHLELASMGTVSSDDFESGTAAGLAGGTTSIIDFVTPARGEPMLDALAERRAAAEKACADYGLHMSVTSWGPDSEAGMRQCVEDEGISSFKTFMAYKDSIGVDDVDLAAILKHAAALGARVNVHAELGDEVERRRNELFAAGKTAPKFHAESRPPELEGAATARAAELASEAHAPLYVVHVTCEESVAAIRAARAAGANVVGETCPQYLLLDDSVYAAPGFEAAAAVMSPPIRAKAHQASLWQALRDDTLQVVATDHCPFNFCGQKELGLHDFRKIPNGAAGIEHRLALLFTYGVLEERLSLPEFVDLTSTRAAKLFGLFPRKGHIAPGSDADLVIWDPTATGTISAATHHHRCDTNLFEGFRTKGAPSTVVAGGIVRARDGQPQAERGAGRFLRRGTP